MRKLTLLDVLSPTNEQRSPYAQLKEEIVGELTVIIARELKGLETRLLEALQK